MPNHSDMLLRSVLGPTLQTASIRMVLLLAVFAALGGGVAWLVR